MVLQEYMEELNASFSIKTQLIPKVEDTIRVMETYDVPVLVFGSYNFPDNQGSGAHAVLAYGYTTDNNLMVHYGWPGYTNVVLDYNLGRLGSMLYITDNNLEPMNISDIFGYAWGKEAIEYCVRYRIIDWEDKAFRKYGPGENMTRGAYVNALFKLTGSPGISQYSASGMYEKFSDFNKKSRFHNAVVWAYSVGLLNGTTVTTISLDATVTREQAATFLCRFSNMKSHDFSDISGPAYTAVCDYSTVASYARGPMNWATRRYLIQGDSGGLRPHDKMTCAECAVMLCNSTVRAKP